MVKGPSEAIAKHATPTSCSSMPIDLFQIQKLASEATLGLSLVPALRVQEQAETDEPRAAFVVYFWIWSPVCLDLPPLRHKQAQSVPSKSILPRLTREF